MSNGTLSQDEIDALLSEAVGGPQTKKTIETQIEIGGITDREKSDLTKIFSEILVSGGVVIGTILNRTANFKNVHCKILNLSEIGSDINKKAIIASTDFKDAISGRINFIISFEDTLKISDIILGETTEAKEEAEFTIQQKNAFTEVMNQFYSSFSHSLTEKLGRSITQGSVTLKTIKPGEKIDLGISDNEIVSIESDLNVEGVMENKVRIIMPVAVARDINQMISGGVKEYTVKEIKTEVRPAATPLTPSVPQETGVRVKPVQFQQFGATTQEPLPTNMQLLLDVPMDVTVELGRTRKLVRDVLELGTGSIIELDKLAGEPVDIMVNGKLVAKGEVVVIDENFGVRVTDIITPMERLVNLQ
ncbi:MAG: flagellar motor switch protein FliN [Candidatus Hydrogenedentota bacterium]